MLEKLLDFFTESVSLKRLKKLLDNNTPSIFYSGSIGSSLAIDFINIIEDSKKNNLFIFSDKEEASYFINDLEKISKKEVFFYPASYRRPYQIEETENTNVLQRAEVLNKLNSKKNTIVITYSEALFEKVISKKEFSELHIDIDVMLARYQSYESLARELKSIGASNKNAGQVRGLSGRKKYLKLKHNFELNFDQELGIPVTYQVFYIKAQSS